MKSVGKRWPEDTTRKGRSNSTINNNSSICTFLDHPQEVAARGAGDSFLYVVAGYGHAAAVHRFYVIGEQHGVGHRGERADERAVERRDGLRCQLWSPGGLQPIVGYAPDLVGRDGHHHGVVSLVRDAPQGLLQLLHAGLCLQVALQAVELGYLVQFLVSFLLHGLLGELHLELHVAHVIGHELRPATGANDGLLHGFLG